MGGGVAFLHGAFGLDIVLPGSWKGFSVQWSPQTTKMISNNENAVFWSREIMRFVEYLVPPVEYSVNTLCEKKNSSSNDVFYQSRFTHDWMKHQINKFKVSKQNNMIGKKR